MEVETPSVSITVSQWDSYYDSYRCCKCGSVVSEDLRTQQLLVDEQVDAWRRAGVALSQAERDEIAQRVSDEESGYALTPRYHIHWRCLRLVLADADWLAELRRQTGSTQGFPVPENDGNWRFYSLSYAYPLRFRCDFCQAFIEKIHPGFAYERTNEQNRHFLHYNCLAALLSVQNPDSRCGDDDDGAPAPPPSLDPLSVKQTNRRWADYLERYRLGDRDRHAFLQWQATVATQQEKWSNEERKQWDSYAREFYEEVAEKEPDESEALEMRREQVSKSLEASRRYPSDVGAVKRATTVLNVIDAALETRPVIRRPGESVDRAERSHKDVVSSDDEEEEEEGEINVLTARQ